MNLEQRLNQLDVDAEKLESETLIDCCFEIGFFPWDNPKFLVFLHWTIEANLRCRGSHRFMRGLIYARHAAAHFPQEIDPDIAADIHAWANCQLTPHLHHCSAAAIADSDTPAYDLGKPRRFARWFWAIADRQIRRSKKAQALLAIKNL